VPKQKNLESFFDNIKAPKILFPFLTDFIVAGIRLLINVSSILPNFLFIYFIYFKVNKKKK